MRPEYEQAVNAVHNGWTFWLIYIVPAIVIWISVFARRGPIIAFLVAWFAGWALHIYHVDYLWAVKEQLMQTPAEERDWASDTGVVFGKVFIIPFIFCYCLAHLVAAKLLRYGYQAVIKRSNKETNLIEHTT